MWSTELGEGGRKPDDVWMRKVSAGLQTGRKHPLFSPGSASRDPESEKGLQEEATQAKGQEGELHGQGDCVQTHLPLNCKLGHFGENISFFFFLNTVLRRTPFNQK